MVLNSREAVTLICICLQKKKTQMTWCENQHFSVKSMTSWKLYLISQFLRSWDRASLYMTIIQLTNQMQLFVLFIDSNTPHVLGVTRPSSGCTHSSWAPDDGWVTPKTCRVLLSIKSIKSYISLVNYMIILLVNSTVVWILPNWQLMSINIYELTNHLWSWCGVNSLHLNKIILGHSLHMWRTPFHSHKGEVHPAT